MAILVFVMVILIITAPVASYFVIGTIVRSLATRTILVKGEDGKEEWVLRPLLWCFVPENTTAYLQRKSNNMVEKGTGSKAIPGSGSGILDMIHAVPGKVLDRTDHDTKKWMMRDCVQGERETHRKGLFYHLYGVHWLGPYVELRVVKIREVRLSIDEDEMKKYRLALEEWKKGGLVGDKPREPSYRSHVKDYDTLFPYFSREHGVIIRGAETAGSFSIDLYENVVYEETYPIRARIEVADPNATLSTMVEKSNIDEVGSHQPEYYLFQDVPPEQQVPGLPPLKKRRDDLVAEVEKDVKAQAEEVIGITIKKLVLYSIDMDDAMRALLELQERTERLKQAEIRAAQHDITIAQKKADKLEADGDGEARKQKKINDGQKDHIERVIMPIASAGELAVRVREAEAYEKNETITTSVRGGGAGILVGGNK